MQLVARVAAVTLVAVASVVSASIGGYWSWVALPMVAADGAASGWERIGPINPAVGVVGVLLALVGVAFFLLACCRVLRSNHLARSGISWSCWSAAVAGLVTMLPGLVVMTYVDRGVPGFSLGPVSPSYDSINALRVWVPLGCLIAGVFVSLISMVRDTRHSQDGNAA